MNVNDLLLRRTIENSVESLDDFRGNVNALLRGEAPDIVYDDLTSAQRVDIAKDYIRKYGDLLEERVPRNETIDELIERIRRNLDYGGTIDVNLMETGKDWDLWLARERAVDPEYRNFGAHVSIDTFASCLTRGINQDEDDALYDLTYRLETWLGQFAVRASEAMLRDLAHQRDADYRSDWSGPGLTDEELISLVIRRTLNETPEVTE